MQRSPDDQFAQFEDELKAITESLARKITTMGAEKDAQAADKIARDCEQDFKDAKTSIERIERDMRAWPFNQKSRAQARVAALNAEVEEQRKQVQDLMDRYDGGGEPAGLSKSDRKRWKDERKRLLGANQAVDNSSISLERTAQTLAEAHAQGAATSATLVEQREIIIRSRDTLRETDSYLVKSRKILRRMTRRVVTNKLIQMVIIILEVAIVVLVVYFKKCSKC